MLNEQTVELINLVIDQQATPAQRAELERILEGAKDCRTEFDAIEQVVRALDSTPDVEPPLSFREDLIAALRQKSPFPIPKHTTTIPVSRRRTKRMWVVAGAWAAAAVLFIVLSLVPMLRSRSKTDPSDAAGAMKAPGMSSWPVAARAASPDGTVHIVLRRNGEQLGVFSRSSRDRVALTLEWNPDELALVESADADGPDSVMRQTTILCSPAGCPPIVFRALGSGNTHLNVVTNGRQIMQFSIPAD